MVEYVLLFAVSTSLVLTFLRSNFYKRMFGEGGKIGTYIKTHAEFSYRHAFPTDTSLPLAPRDIKTATDHPSYYLNGDSRFFGAVDPYP